MLAAFIVRPGTDPKYPSFRIIMPDYKFDPEKAETSREIAVVFKHGENMAEMRDFIKEQVAAYVRLHPFDDTPVEALHDPAVLGARSTDVQA